MLVPVALHFFSSCFVGYVVILWFQFYISLMTNELENVFMFIDLHFLYLIDSIVLFYILNRSLIFLNLGILF